MKRSVVTKADIFGKVALAPAWAYWLEVASPENYETVKKDYLTQGFFVSPLLKRDGEYGLVVASTEEAMEEKMAEVAELGWEPALYIALGVSIMPLLVVGAGLVLLGGVSYLVIKKGRSA